MAPVTEVVLLTLVPNADYGPIAESLKILARQPGCLAARASRLHHDPAQVHYFIDWETVDSHLAFARNQPVYAPFRALVGSVMAAFHPPYHVRLSPFPPDVFDGAGAGTGRAVAMVGKAWFPGPSGLAAAEMEGAADAFAAFVRALGERGVEGLTGRVAHGWSVEDAIAEKGGPSRVFLFAVGWDCVEAYLRFRDSGQLAEIGSVMTGLKKLVQLEMCVVNTTDTGMDTAA
ncbi:hypothetical protein F4824DRAFT_326172 [Ustulina deusta]|nr:hypothetical protein F4824DRAFT_326172 [Ustulina deusta]